MNVLRVFILMVFFATAAYAECIKVDSECIPKNLQAFVDFMNAQSASEDETAYVDESITPEEQQAMRDLLDKMFPNVILPHEEGLLPFPLD